MDVKRTRFPWLYLTLAYALAWVFWIPIALTRQDYQSSPVLLVAFLIGVLGPGIAGIAMTYVEQGREGGRDFWRRASDVRRVRPLWWLAILFLWPLLHLSAIAGPVADRLGERTWFVVAGAAMVAMGVCSLLIPAVMQIEDEDRRSEVLARADPAAGTTPASEPVAAAR